MHRLDVRERHGGGRMSRGARPALGTVVLVLALVARAGVAAGPAAGPPPRAAGTEAPEKLAVLVMGTTEKDAYLADNLTEIVIAHIAQRKGVELAGREEFRARLGVENEQRAQACIDDLGCLGRAAVSLGVRRIVAGTVGLRGNQFLFSLNLNNVENNTVENHIFRLVEGGIPDLIAAVESSTEELFRPRVEPGRIQITTLPTGARVSIDNAYLGITPLISGTLLAGRHKVRVEADDRFPWISAVEVVPGQELGVNLTERNLPERRSWPAAAAGVSAALAAVSFATGGFLGVLSQVTPSGATRAEAQSDFDQKQRFGTGANVAFIAGGVFTAAAIYLVARYHDDIFGRPTSELGAP